MVWGLNKFTKIMVQGITGTQASFHVQRAIDSGSNIVAGISPNKGGTFHLGVPVFGSVKEAKAATGADVSLMFVPPKSVKRAIREAVEAELKMVVCITDGIAVKDMLEVKHLLKNSTTKLVGPNTPGIIVPDVVEVGIFPTNIYQKGNVAIVSRASTLTYETVLETNRAGMGQSAVVGLGDDMLIGISFVDVLEEFARDEKTKAIVMIGRMGGVFEEQGAKWYAEQKNKKPVVAFVAGSNINFGANIGYAGDLITEGRVLVDDKKKVLQDAGIIVVDNINQIHQELIKLNIK